MIASAAGVVSLFPLLFTPAGMLCALKCMSSQANFSKEQIIEVVYSLLWAIVVFGPLQQRLYESVTLRPHLNMS
jgi:alpha-1,3-glucosyltransferase